MTLAGLTIANGLVFDGLGGGIANEAGATLHLINDTVAYNTAYGIGGGLWNDGGANGLRQRLDVHGQQDLRLPDLLLSR